MNENYEYFGIRIIQSIVVVIIINGNQVFTNPQIFTYLPHTNIQPASLTIFQLVSL